MLGKIVNARSDFYCKLTNNLLLFSCMAFYDKSKSTEAVTVITVQLVNFHNLMFLLLGRAFSMTWISVNLFHGG